MASVDDFLDAPEGSIGNPTTRRRYILQQAREDAEQRRDEAEESVSDAEILADIVRVASDPDTNPMGWKFKQISRPRYRHYGFFPIEWVDSRWGQFHRALELAGLRDQPGTRRAKAAKARDDREGQVRGYEEQWILPYVYDPSQRVHTGTELVLSISDTHATHLDPGTWLAFLRAVQAMEPDWIVFNGDILEGSAISGHKKRSLRTIPLQVEFDFARTMFEQTRALAPDAELVWVAGNHGLSRMSAYLAQVAPALADLRSLRFDQLAGLDDLGVLLAQGGELASPENQEDHRPGLLLHDFYRIHHGTKLGQNPSMGELKAAGRSGQSGHVHRAGLSWGATEAEGAMSWMSTPAGCNDDAGREYMRGTCTGWQSGFGAAYLHPGGRVHQFPVVTSDRVAICEGLYMELPEFPRMPWDRNWLADFKGCA